MSEEANEPDLLRLSAEAQVASDSPELPHQLLAQKLLHDLQVCQIALQKKSEELRQAQRALKAPLDCYSDLYEFTSFGYLSLNNLGIIEQVNLTAAALLGLERSKLLQQDFASYVTSADRPLWQHHFNCVQSDESQRFIELSLQRSNGKCFYARLECTHLSTPGTSFDMRIILSGITKQKRTGDVLRARDKRFKAPFNRACEGILILASDGKLIDANESCAKMHGYSVPELLSMNINALVAPESSLLTAERLERIFSGDHLSFETEHYHKDGYTFPVELSASLISTDNSMFIQLCIRDISEHKLTDELLSKSVDDLYDLYHNAACGYHSLSIDGTFLLINDTELTWLGYARDEVVGKMKITDILTPKSIQTFERSFPKLVKLGVNHDIELEIIRKNRTVFVGLINASVVFNDAGEFVMTRSTVVDISVRKHAEVQLHELTAHLSTVREEEKAYLAREIHDELGSSLAALKIDASMLTRNLPTTEQMLPLRKCAESISELLDTAIKSTREIVTNLRPGMLDHLGLIPTLEWYSDEFSNRTGIECKVASFCDDNVCDKNLSNSTLSINLFRIFQEALTNVVRHSKASCVSVEIHLNHDEAILSVSDNGCGLSAGHDIQPTSYGIRGMRERVAQLQGEIEFDSQPGSGLCVTVKLPISAPPITEATLYPCE
ncbi:MAG: PAS domain S-box protein [Gallionellaceae bacterium]